jgi:histidine triad (HIT) family protein
MAADTCTFCKIISGQIPVTKVYEDPDVLAFLDIGPISDGHTLVIPRQHFENLNDCPAEVLAGVASILGRVAMAVVSAVGADGYNLLCNNGRAAGQVVNHLHFHIIPRRSGDGVFDRWPSYKYPKGKIDEIAAKIKAGM